MIILKGNIHISVKTLQETNRKQSFHFSIAFVNAVPIIFSMLL